MAMRMVDAILRRRRRARKGSHARLDATVKALRLFASMPVRILRVGAKCRTDMNERTVDRLILIFDADSGKVSAFFDSLRKALALPSCSLCALTHGLAGEKPEWVDAKRRLAIEVQYLHRDELSGDIRLVATGRLPCILGASGADVVMLVEPKDILACDGSIRALEEKILGRAAEFGFTMPERPPRTGTNGQ